MYKNMFTQSLEGPMEDLVEADDSGHSSGDNSHKNAVNTVPLQLGNVQTLSQTGSEGLMLPNSSKLKFLSTVR